MSEYEINVIFIKESQEMTKMCRRSGFFLLMVGYLQHIKKELTPFVCLIDLWRQLGNYDFSYIYMDMVYCTEKDQACVSIFWYEMIIHDVF